MKNINTNRSQKVQKEPFYFFKWIIKIELVIILFCLIINLIPGKIKFIIKYNFEKSFCFEIKNKDFNYDNIIQALEENKNIKKEEKIFISNVLENEIKENKDYIDIKNVIKKLRSFEISYSEINDSKTNVAGSYNSLFNRISLKEKDFESSNKRAYFHELNHLISKSKLNNRNIISETINELFTREYFGSDSNENQGYEKYMMNAYVLAEILPEDIIKKYKFTDNLSVLISGFLENDDNIDEVYKLIDSINSYEKDYNKIHDGYAYFYEKKYNKNMSDDLNILIYFYGTPIQTEEEREKIREYLEMDINDEIISISPKGYISNEYKEKHNFIKIEYTKNGKKEITEIR